MKKNLLLVFIGLVIVFIGGLSLRYYFPDLRGPHIPVYKIGLEVVSEIGTDTLLSAGNVVLNILSQGDIFALQELIASDGLTFLPYPNY